ncbi:MAG: hypothetical protein ACO1TE_02260 [Prosthecobacter sp.]
MGEYPNAVVTTLGEQEARVLMQEFPALLEAFMADSHRRNDYLSGYGPEVLEMYRQGGYVVQIVPFTDGGRRLAHLHLVSTDSTTDHAGNPTAYWRSHYKFISDGGHGNSFVVINLDTREILLATVSGHG